MQANALYLDLVAKELVEAVDVNLEAIIQKVTDNPENIFSLSMIRLKRHGIWETVLYPILGVLLAARAPLAIQTIGKILNLEDYKLREGLSCLGGLVAVGEGQKYSLFHLNL